MKRKIKALIPVRSGSLRVENKNIRPFCGSTLLEIRVRQLLSLSFLDGVVVSSNDSEMLRIARSMGAETHQRDPYFASNTVSMSEVYENMASAMQCDDILYALVTTPLVRSESFNKAFELYHTLPKEYDSITTVADVKEFLILNGKPFNYDGKKIPRSQDLPDIMKLTFCISILPRDIMIEKKSCLGKSPYFFRLPQEESIDIDTPFDFKVAELLYGHFFINNQ
ncbi:MAG: acylneuraminate cytidylyltransferase family protein [Flammeovirgaceae bacterium]|nr:MAG: acylneuraminate cytidylyltransferase family protein [Flammeovirgaceae bacterium]